LFDLQESDGKKGVNILFCVISLYGFPEVMGCHFTEPVILF